MKNLRQDIHEALSNENGGPSVEQILGIGVALGVGVALYLVGSAMYNWLAGDGGASSVISGLDIATPEGFAGKKP